MPSLCGNPKARLFIVILMMLIVGAITLDRAVFHQDPKTDFTVYTLASQAVLDGADIYKIQNVRGWNYVYLPLFSIVMIPLAKLPLWLGVIAWYLISLAAAFHSIRMCVAMARPRESTENDAVVLSYIPILTVICLLMDGIVRGQASVLMAWLVMAGLYFEWKKSWMKGSACLAAAVLLKVFPVLLLGYFVLRKKWRFAVATLAWIGAGVFLVPALVFGWRRNLALLDEWTAIVGKPALSIGRESSPLFEQLLDPTKLRNQSFEAVFSRILPHANATLLAIAAGSAMTVIMLAAARRNRDWLLFLSSALCGLLLVSPVSENHYFLLLLLPVTTLAALRRQPPAKWILVQFFAADVAWECFDSARFYGSLCWGTFGLWLALIFFSMRNGANPDDSPVHFAYSE